MRKINFELINVFFTSLIVISACVSSYYSYMTVKIASANIDLLEAQDARESRRELKEMTELLIKLYQISNDKNSAEESADK